MRELTESPTVAVAPMMDWTDRHCRYFLRLLSPRVRLYTEMVTAKALIHGDDRRLLRFDPAEHPVALQLGGSDPGEMARAAEMGAEIGYDEININVGCPSDRVRDGQFGACLMSRPDTVAECVAAMREAVDVPITVKTRIGIDDHDSYGFLCDFVVRVAEAGCGRFIVHARIAILGGLSPKENRTVPPLDYERVYRLKREHPDLVIALNGGIRAVDEVSTHFREVDGVMIGREAYQNPWFLVELEKHLGREEGLPENRHEVLERMLPYVERELAAGTGLKAIARHLLGLFAGQPGARAWRRHLSENAHRPGAGVEVLQAAAEQPELAA